MGKEQKAKPKPFYTLTFYRDGKIHDAIGTTDADKAKRLYWNNFIKTGAAPRLNIDGVEKTISEADKIMQLPKAVRAGRKKPPFINHRLLKPKTP